jgi:programmed cell death 6-interacting protein
MSAASANRETKLQSRALRRLVESVDDIQRERADIVRRARQLADADDITPQIARQAAGLARWTEVNPSMFEDMMEAELLKFGKFAKDVERDSGRQEEMLRDMRVGGDARRVSFWN